MKQQNRQLHIRTTLKAFLMFSFSFPVAIKHSLFLNIKPNHRVEINKLVGNNILGHISMIQ